MEGSNFKNLAFLILLVVVLGGIFTYLTISKYKDSSIYATLFYREEE